MSVMMVLWRERERRRGGVCTGHLLVGPGDRNTVWAHEQSQIVGGAALPLFQGSNQKITF